ncbi:MAG TPA: cytochrome b/b6 domain-containing protein [Brevundimonas sp.]|nr:cytochrome b/b6 domain-containing protein [Brevundimonas sp.]
MEPAEAPAARDPAPTGRSTTNAGYTSVAIVLHWLTALAVTALIPMGWWMSRAVADPDSQAAAYRVFQLHKSIGLTVLALTVLRIGWRLTHRAPDAEAGARAWEVFVARMTHFAFYGLLLLLPLSGWLYVSTGWAAGPDQALTVATSWFGLITVPHLPGVESLTAGVRRVLAFQAVSAHKAMAWGAVFLIVLHAGAALKHHLLDRDDVLTRMLPVLRRREPSAPSGVTAGDATASSAATASVAGPSRHRTASALVGLALAPVIGLLGWSLAQPEARDDLEAPASTSATPVVLDGPVSPGSAQAWTVDEAASGLEFSGTHAGVAFRGRFEVWRAHIWFDPADLAGSKAVVIVSTGSARIPDATQEASLRDPEWFDPARYPSARFDATAFRSLGGDRYEAAGTLRIKDRIQPVVLPFTFRETARGARVEGSLTLDRFAFDLGMASDAAGDWVSREIRLHVSVEARPSDPSPDPRPS